MNIQADFILREWKLTDVVSLSQQANNINIWNNVRDHFPHPYTEADAEQFIKMVIENPKPVTDFAIIVDDKSVGGIGLVLQQDVERITVELGYWLGEEYWGQGIMTEAVKRMTKYAFDNFPVVKIFAPVYDFNIASQKVLQKAGFECEAILKKASIKNEKIIDLHYHSLIKNEN